MSAELTYFRKYIILENNYTNIANLNPKGHVKIEVRGAKGNISLNVENCEMGKDYRVYFLKDKDGGVKELDLGRIITDERGRTRTNIRLNLRDLRTKGFLIDEIDAILIRNGMYVLLGGYIDNNNGTIERFVKKLMSQEIESEEIEPEEIESEEIELEEIEPEEIELEEIELEEIEPEEIEPEEIEPEEIEPEPIEQSQHIKITNQPSNYQSLEYTRQINHRNQMNNYILSVLRFFPCVEPLKMYLHGYSWWRIEDDGTNSYKGFLPYYNYLMSSDYKYPFLNNSTTCLNLIKKYNHYLFGIYKENGEIKYYIYAVPGKFTIQEHPFKGVTGFNTWYESVNEIGYWILYIDSMTGKIIHPINPMVPVY